MTDLERRIVAALSDETVTAAQLAELGAETESAITAFAEAASVSREQSLDPALCSDPKAARSALEGAEICRGRLLTLQPRLQQRYHEVDEAEDRASWREDFSAAAEIRNALSRELADVYPTVAAQLATLFAKIAANDAALSRLHAARPPSAKGHLLGAELHARGLTDYTRDQPSLLRTTVLPDWTQSNNHLWPPRSAPTSVIFAEMQVPTFDPRYSADWHEALAADTERRKSEEQRGIKNEAAAQEESRRAFERTLPR